MNKLDTNYLYEVDKKELFISLTIDWCFKKVFDKYFNEQACCTFFRSRLYLSVMTDVIVHISLELTDSV